MAAITRVFACSLCLLAGCATPMPPPETPPHPHAITVSRQLITPQEALAVDEILERAQTHFVAERYTDAAKDFDRVYEFDADGPFALRALWGAAESLDLAGENPDALARYERIVRVFPDEPQARTALVRSVRLASYLERWQSAGVHAEVVLARYEALRPFEAIVVYSGKALALISEGNDEAASYYVAKGLTIVEEERFDAAGPIPRDVAQLYYAEGEIRRVRAERIQFSPTPHNFGVVLEERCRLILDAQSSYSDTMRAYDAHWSSMAGFRVGELYQRLHRDLMHVQPPQQVTELKQRQLFEGAMRLRYSVLLTKARAMMEHTVRLAERTREHSAWTQRAAEALRQLEHAQKEETAALEALPYTREDLQNALDTLTERARNKRLDGR